MLQFPSSPTYSIYQIQFMMAKSLIKLYWKLFRVNWPYCSQVDNKHDHYSFLWHSMVGGEGEFVSCYTYNMHIGRLQSYFCYSNAVHAAIDSFSKRIFSIFMSFQIREFNEIKNNWLQFTDITDLCYFQAFDWWIRNISVVDTIFHGLDTLWCCVFSVTINFQ